MRTTARRRGHEREGEDEGERLKTGEGEDEGEGLKTCEGEDEGEGSKAREGALFA